jgi:hypothetical protein
MLNQHKRLPCTGTTCRKRTSGVHGLPAGSVLSNMSNCLVCGRQHIVIAGMMAHGGLMELIH